MNEVNAGEVFERKVDDAGERGYKIYAALRYVPVVLFVVFAAAVLGIFALPVARVYSVNSYIPEHAAGNFYSALGGLLNFDEHVHNAVIAYYVAIALGLIYAAFALFTLRGGKFGKRDIDSPVGATFAGNITSGFYIIYLIFLTLTFIVLGRIIAIDEGGGVLEVGASVWAIFAYLVFATVVHAASVIVRYRMERKDERLKKAEQDRLA